MQYVTSVDRLQLRGSALGAASLGACSPVVENGGQPFYPCGLIADSSFNDTFIVDNLPAGSTFQQHGIAWPSDVETLYATTSYEPGTVLPPPSWNQVQNNGTWPPSSNWITGNEHLMNWMRVSAFSSFLKLYAIIDDFNGSLSQLTLTIADCFPIGQAFGGTKSIVLSSQSLLVGGRIMALPIIFTVAGALLLLIALATLLLHERRQNRMATSVGDYSDVVVEVQMLELLRHMKQEA